MRRDSTKKIDELVNQVLEGMGLAHKLKEYEIKNIWPEVVGQMIASYTKQIDVVNGKLFVSFTSSVVKNEISMVKEGLIQALNDKVGKPVINEIIIR